MVTPLCVCMRPMRRGGLCSAAVEECGTRWPLPWPLVVHPQLPGAPFSEVLTHLAPFVLYGWQCLQHLEPFVAWLDEHHTSCKYVPSTPWPSFKKRCIVCVVDNTSCNCTLLCAAARACCPQAPPHGVLLRQLQLVHRLPAVPGNRGGLLLRPT